MNPYLLPLRHSSREQFLFDIAEPEKICPGNPYAKSHPMQYINNDQKKQKR